MQIKEKKESKIKSFHEDLPEKIPEKKYHSKGVRTKLNNAADKMFFNTNHS